MYLYLHPSILFQINVLNGFQTAERIRQEYPGQGIMYLSYAFSSLTVPLDYDWFHLTGLIHDCGKILSLLGEPPVCCACLNL